MVALGFVRACVLYFIAALTSSVVMRDGEWLQAFHATGEFTRLIADRVLPMVVALGVLAWIVHGRRGHRVSVRDLVLAGFGTAIFYAGFIIFKTAMPSAVPFHADPSLAELDRLLHLGHDPWAVLHRLAPSFDPDIATTLYVDVWLASVVCFPAFLILYDRDAARARRFLVLYLAAWVLVGNVLALAFLSGGPVYYDRIVGGDRFVDLTSALAQSGVLASVIGGAQDFLWQAHVQDTSLIGSGISAFPSVHVAVATVIALYARERHPVLALPGAVYVLTILFLSVYLGWHYALDGYASIAVVALLWLWLRSREAGATDAGARDDHALARYPRPAPRGAGN